MEESVRLLGLEWHRWLFFLFAWLPWLGVELWYFFRMKDRFRRKNRDLGQDESDLDESLEDLEQ